MVGVISMLVRVMMVLCRLKKWLLIIIDRFMILGLGSIWVIVRVLMNFFFVIYVSCLISLCWVMVSMLLKFCRVSCENVRKSWLRDCGWFMVSVEFLVCLG